MCGEVVYMHGGWTELKTSVRVEAGYIHGSGLEPLRESACIDAISTHQADLLHGGNPHAPCWSSASA